MNWVLVIKKYKCVLMIACYIGVREKNKNHVMYASASRWKIENEGVNDRELNETSVLRKQNQEKAYVISH